MNNIKVLEEYLDKQDRKFVSEHRLMILEAIEYLIKENKELKKQMGKDLDVVYIKGVYDERDKWKSKVKELAKKYEFALNGYDSSSADYKQSQDLGRYLACVELLNEGE